MNKRKQRVDQLNRVSSKKRTKIFSLVFGLAFVLAGAAAFSSAGAETASDITAEKIIELTNKSRREKELGALADNGKLSRAAQAKAADMLANNYFSHTSPAGATPWSWIQKENYNYNYAGENLAMDFHSAEKMEEAWMASPTHRANIVNEKYSEIGTAVKTGSINGRETTLAVVMFGSGDKSQAKEENIQKKIAKSNQASKSENKFPVLPAGEEKKNAIVFERPVITSPRPGEIVSESETKIFGRARPGEKIVIYDGGDMLGSANTDSDGWFLLEKKDLSEGAHSLAPQVNNIFFGAKTDFSVDREKPEVYFRLYASKNNPRRFFLETSSDKNDCAFRFNGETRNILQKRKSLFVFETDKSSAILRVADQAGNKSFSQINFANYYFENKENSISDKLTRLMAAPKHIFAADSGREALKNNLRLSAVIAREHSDRGNPEIASLHSQ